MTETFNENVVIDGSEDAIQLSVQGHATQTEALQNWEDSAGGVLARVTGEGKLQLGDLGLSTPAALVEASADLTSATAKPKRGLHALGRFTGALTEALTWAVHELELGGSGGITTLQTAFRAKITNKNTGTISSAEFRAADFQAINEEGGSENAVEQLTALHSSVNNAANAHTTKVVGIEVEIANDTDGVITDAIALEVVSPNNDGTLSTLYGLRIADLNQGTENFALYTGEGIIHLGDHQELHIAAATPTENPPSNFIKLYPKLFGGAPALFAKDSSGTEYNFGNGVSGSGDLLSDGTVAMTGDFQIDDNALIFQEISTPAPPASGDFKLYFKANGRAYTQNSLGEESELGSDSSLGNLHTVLFTQIFS